MAETATWSWEARDVGGRLVRGTLAAASASEVAARLRSEGRVVLGIERAIGVLLIVIAVGLLARII